MPGMLGVIDSHHTDYDKQLLSESIDLLSLGKTKTINFQDGFVSVSSLRRTPLKGKRWIEQEDKIFCFSGDLAGVAELPWKEIINIIKQKNYDKFKDYQGLFAVTCIDKKNKKVTIVSDRRAQHPIYYKILETGFVFSTELSTFCRFNEQAKFNRNWLYEFLFFNFPIGETTFIKKVNRMPPATVLEFDYHKLEISFTTYADIFCRKTKLLEGNKALEKATDIFRGRVPQYFKGVDEVACAITDGWDARTILSFTPENKKILTYTYGLRGSDDLLNGSKTSKHLELDYQQIIFDDNFEKNLPAYLFNTVFLSSGLQTILRSTLLYAYESLTKEGNRLPLIITGIALDELFRGHDASPTPISEDMDNIFSTGRLIFRKNFWQAVFGATYQEFTSHIESKLIELEEKLGKFDSAEHHLLYKLCVLGPSYFSGELKIAENFTTMRVPSWDTQIIELALSIDKSALSFSSYKNQPKSSREIYFLQSYLICNFRPELSKIPIRNTRPDIVLTGDNIYKLYMLYRVIYKKAIIFHKRRSKIENWDYWLNNICRDYIDQLIFSESSLIREFIDKKFINKIRSERNTHWVGKLVTAEIIMRLVNNRWMNNGI